MRKYYDTNGTLKQEEFNERLNEIHNKVDGAETLEELLSIRNKLYRLKAKYEECGTRFLECEYEILALNEIIEEERDNRKNVNS